MSIVQALSLGRRRFQNWKKKRVLACRCFFFAIKLTTLGNTRSFGFLVDIVCNLSFLHIFLKYYLQACIIIFVFLSCLFDFGVTDATPDQNGRSPSHSSISRHSEPRSPAEPEAVHVEAGAFFRSGNQVAESER